MDLPLTLGPHRDYSAFEGDLLSVSKEASAKKEKTCKASLEINRDFEYERILRFHGLENLNYSEPGRDLMDKCVNLVRNPPPPVYIYIYIYTHTI